MTTTTVTTSDATAADRGARNLTLDAWRGLSVLLVICYHGVFFRFQDFFRPQALALDLADTFPSFLAANAYRLIVYAGPLGVKFFFVISGYIITKLLQEEHRRAGRVSLSAFYVRRACRILPVLWLFIGCLCVATALHLIEVTPRAVAFGLAFICNTSVTACYSDWFLAHLWSLSVEEQFYLAWPLLVLLFAARGIWRIALAFGAVFLALAQVSLFFVGEWNNGLSFACIAAGALYASHAGIRRYVARLASVPVIALVALAVFARPFIPLLFPGQFRLHDLLTPLLICFLIFSSFEHRALLERTMAVRSLAKVGVVSYGLYLWQQLFLASPDHYLRPSLLTQTYLLVPVVMISYFALERPFVRLGAALSKRLSRANRASFTPARPA